jgi:hypothetical protein
VGVSPRLLFLLLLGACAGRPAPRPVHPDVALLRRSFEALHPGLHRYLRPAELEAAFAELSAALHTSRTPGESFLALSIFTAKIRCGHTYPNFFNQKKEVEEALFQGPRVPFLFRWLEGRLVITRSFTPSLRVGDEVVTLAGIPASELRARLLRIARADGANDAKRASYIGLHGDSRYEAFDVFLPLLVPLGTDLPLEVRAPDGRSRTLRVPFMTFAERSALLPAEPEGALWKLEMPLPDVGYLRMPTWVTYHTKWDWEADLAATMQRLADGKVRRLVVDLRGNEGGTDVGDVLVAHMIEAELPEEPVVRRTRYRSVPADLRPHLDTWDPSFFDRGDSVEDLGDDWFRLTGRRSRTIAPRAPHFQGELVVLVDAANSSATSLFAERVQRRRLGVLVGEPTGGNRRGLNGGSFFFLRLPATGIEVDLPLVGVFPVEPQRDAGVIPDVVVRPTARDIAEGRDPALETALRKTFAR